MGEVIVTPPRVREEEKVENQTEENQEAENQAAPDSSSIIENDNSTTTDTSPANEKKSEEENPKEEKIMNIQEVVGQISESTQEIGQKIKDKRNWVALLIGALFVCSVLYLSGHLVWENGEPRILSTQNYYDRGYSKSIQDIEKMSWWERIWRAITGDFHSK